MATLSILRGGFNQKFNILSLTKDGKNGIIVYVIKSYTNKHKLIRKR